MYSNDHIRPDRLQSLLHVFNLALFQRPFQRRSEEVRRRDSLQVVEEPLRSGPGLDGSVRQTKQFGDLDECASAIQNGRGAVLQLRRQLLQRG